MPPENKPTPDNTPHNSIVDADSERQLKHIAQNATAPGKDLPEERPVEHGGQAGLEPTRYGDWEKKGRCTDF